MNHSTTFPAQSVLSKNDIPSETDDYEYMLPPIGAVALDPFGRPGTIWRVVHTSTDTWMLLVPGGWFRSQYVDFGPR